MYQSIGKVIYELRKLKNITQEELGNALGVSAQAVSKWEAGGSPDIELIPKLADYFIVTTDYLFGYKNKDRINIYELLSNHILEAKANKRFQVALKCSWAIQMSLGGHVDLDTLDDMQTDDSDCVSQMLFDNGYSQMGLNKEQSYFFLIPETNNGYGELLNNIDYVKFFQFIGEQDTWDSLIFLYSRNNKPFTIKLIESKLKLTKERAVQILESLKEYKLITSKEIELDDNIIETYEFHPNPSFISMLVFAKEVIHKPSLYKYWYDCRDKSYLNTLESY